MEKIILPNGEVELINDKILFVKFEGNITDDDYKEIWETGVEKAIELNIEHFIFDQSKIGQVSFKARGWVILKMLPRIKKELSKGLKIGVVSSKDLVNKSGVKYLVGMFEKMASLNVNFYADFDTAVNEVTNM